MSDATLTSPIDLRAKAPPMPGVIVVLAAREPRCVPYVWTGKSLTLGRRDCDITIADLELSKLQAELQYLGDGVWRVADLGTKNGTFVNNVLVSGASMEHEGASIVVRAGGTIVLLERDMGRFNSGDLTVDEQRVMGPAQQLCFQLIDHAAKNGDNLLVQGETGTGKENAAARYHFSSSARGPFVAVNCAAIAKNVAEAELFGVKKGAFTGADGDRPGFFGEADKGTLFLDEIGTLDLELQAKLLRVLQELVLQPVGGGARKIDVRVVAATNVDLRAAVERGTFRHDLFMRLAQQVVVIPPLRERPEEIAPLVFFALRQQKQTARPSPAFVEECLLRPWPANVRELFAAVKMAVAAAKGAAVLSPEDLQEWVGRVSTTPSESEEPPAGAKLPNDPKLAELVRKFEELGSVDLARKAVGVSRTTAYRWLQFAGVLKK